MANIKIGIISKEKMRTIDRAISRQQEIDQDKHKGFKSKHSVYKSKKTYCRKIKHKGRDF